MATFKLVGGIGNQLFIAAAAAAHALRFGKGVSLLDARHIARTESQGGSHKFRSDISLVALPEILKLRKKGESDFSYFFDTISGAVNSLMPNSKSLNRLFYTSKKLGFDSEIFRFQPLYVRGYFQSFRYLEFLQNRNVSFNPVPLSPSEDFQEKRASLLQGSPFGIVHVRRGDYRAVGNQFGLLDANYYSKSIDLARERSEIQRFLVFSDESESLLEQDLRRVIDKKGLEFFNTGTLPPHEVLSLMSLARAFCIANSSFSWWAAALSQAEIVVFPDPWFRKSDGPFELTAPQWIPLEASWTL